MDTHLYVQPPDKLPPPKSQSRAEGTDLSNVLLMESKATWAVVSPDGPADPQGYFLASQTDFLKVKCTGRRHPDSNVPGL